ncbi:MAG: hypothetical protein JOZ96_01245 [Acidobacteria bacterium]|nr:hypothetical protein [Acidobacteriota bacterium]MBV9923636.1 hypothetical protein [Acidobacteriota bacterium]
MKSPKLLRRLTTHACVALFLLSFAAEGFAQRRRATNAPRTETQAPARPSPAPAAPPPSRAQQSQPRRAEPDLSVEEMLAEDSYTAYVELRRVGMLARAEEVKSAVAALRLLGGDEAKPVTDLYAFVSDNAEALGESRVVVCFLPARAEVPQALLAVELESSEAAAAFEPKLRRMLGERVPQVKKAIGAAMPEPVVVPKPDARGAAAKPPAPDFALKRVGRWLLASDTAFTLKRLRGDEDRPRLADSPRFQSVRSRFASDSLFVYVDTNVAQQGWALQVQRASERQQTQEVTTVATTEPPPPTIVGAVPATTETAPVNPEAPPEETATAPEMSAEERAAIDVEERTVVTADEAAEREKAPPPSEEEVAVRGMEGVLRGLWSGVPRIPGAVALGARLDAGSLAVRLAVENTPDGTVALIPFLPNIVSGPPVTGETAAVAPADAELFVAGSLDWTQVYTQTLGAAAVNPAALAASFGGGDEGDAKAEHQPTVDETVAAVEKLFGFKFKDDLLPALGNEVAVSLPLTTGDFGFGRTRPPEEKKEEREAEPGFLYLAALHNPDRVREILPRVLVAFGISPPGTPPRSEKRKGFEIQTLGAGEGLSYTFINNFLVAGELKAVRHCVDSFDARQTLAATNAYRDAVAWQAKQKLLHLYLSDSLLRDVSEETKRRSGGSTDPAVRALLAQLETAETAPASYEATNEGDVVMHEARFPVSLVRTYALTAAVAVKDSAVITNEAMAVYALQRVMHAEQEYKDGKKKGRFGTLDELVAEGMLEKTFFENMEYKLEVKLAGDELEVSATPKSYGKTGRRSFYLDQKSQVHAADRGGEPATPDDPVVEP